MQTIEVTPTNQKPERLLRRAVVQDRTSLSVSELYRRMAAGTFPKPVVIGAQSVAWRESEVDAWIAALTVTEAIRTKAA
jgi:prophage regulatory protein